MGFVRTHNILTVFSMLCLAQLMSMLYHVIIIHTLNMIYSVSIFQNNNYIMGHCIDEINRKQVIFPSVKVHDLYIFSLHMHTSLVKRGYKSVLAGQPEKGKWLNILSLQWAI